MKLSNLLIKLSWMVWFFYCFMLSSDVHRLVVFVDASHEIYQEFQSLEANTIQYLYRTGYHFQPPKNWINDPNGPMLYKGVYHLFYQYNPKGAVWGNIIWAHSVSKDLINWYAVEPALYPSKPFDINGCWSGSATVLPGDKPIILYTGIDPQKRQVQNIALPANLSDPYLLKWIKPDYNPLIVPSPDIEVNFFRDPTTAWWTNGHWKILVGGRRVHGHNHRGMAHLYRSRDFRRWVKAKHPLHSAPHTGMWECPDFYPVLVEGKNGLDTSVASGNIKHVLKVSLDETRYEYYTIGTYDLEHDKYIPDNTSVDGWSGLRYDYGNFYASKSFYDNKLARRILWGWSNESSAQADDVKKGWAGIQAIPRTVWLDSNGRQLLQWPVEEVETLRGSQVQLSKLELDVGDHAEIKGITAAQADVEVTFSFPSLENAEAFDPSWTNAQDLCGQMGSTVVGGLGPFGLLTLASDELDEFTAVFFRVFKAQNNKHVVLMCSDDSRSSLNESPYKPSFAGYVDVDLTERKLSLRSLIDNSAVESFGAGGKTVITSRVYPTKAIFQNAHLYAFNNGIETVTIENLNAWSMASPKLMNNNN
ncbi:Invertase [Ancistrocladus abbreviatus]